MSYKNERDEAAKTATFKPDTNNPDILYGIANATPRTAWKAGHDHGVFQSEVVKELVDACKAAATDRFGYITHQGCYDSLVAYEQAKKEAGL